MKQYCVFDRGKAMKRGSVCLTVKFTIKKNDFYLRADIFKTITIFLISSFK